jgi:broad specificity phosphatase PhoE
VPTVLLVRHGRTAANASGVLAGWTPGIGLDETGQKQASALAERLAAVPIVLAVSSPLQRCQETSAALLAVPFSGPDTASEPTSESGDGESRDGESRDGGSPDREPGDGEPDGGEPRPLRPALLTDDRLGECKYGDWTGRPLKDLVKEPLWRVVQAHPSAVTFPGEAGESMLTMQHRAVSAIREYDAKVAAEYGDDAIWLAVSHGDVIKGILADALGMHFDAFQRLVVDPCSVSVIRFTPLRPFAVRLNDAGTDLAALVPVPARERTPGAIPEADPSDAVVGGSAGGAAAPAGTS